VQASGTLKKTNLPDLDFEGINTTVSKIIQLLSFHSISFFNSSEELWVALKTADTGKVRAILVDA